MPEGPLSSHSPAQHAPEQHPPAASEGETTQQAGYIPQPHAEVNKGSVNMRFNTGRLNEMGQQGWHLHSIFEQDKNTIIVFERMIPHPQSGATQQAPPQVQQPPPWGSR